MEPLISIIVPVYNVESYLPRCLDSIINQSYKNLEIILVNDESTDNSLSICNEYKDKDDRIKLISIEHGGLSKARNVGLDNAKGKYIGFVDSDDFIEPDMYKDLYKALKDNKAEISVCTFYRYNEGGLGYDFEENRDKIVFNREEAIENILIDKTIRNYVWTKLYKASIFDDLRFPEGRNYEDIFISIKILEKIKKLVYINKHFYYYVIREGSIDSSKLERNIRDSIEETYKRYKYVKETYKERFKEYNIIPMIERLVHCYINSGKDATLLNEYNYIFTELDEDINTSNKDLIKENCVPNFLDYYFILSNMIDK